VLRMSPKAFDPTLKQGVSPYPAYYRQVARHDGGRCSRTGGRHSPMVVDQRKKYLGIVAALSFITFVSSQISFSHLVARNRVITELPIAVVAYRLRPCKRSPLEIRLRKASMNFRRRAIDIAAEEKVKECHFWIGTLLAFLIVIMSWTLAVAHAQNWIVYQNVKYGSTDQERADFYILNSGVHPAVVFIHGGAWQTGDKSAYAQHYARLYLSAGFNVVSINYRLAKNSDSTTQWNAPLQDAQEAIRFIREGSALLRIDPNRIAAAGDSAGAHLALFLGSLDTCSPNLAGGADRCSLITSRSSKVNAVLDMFGPVDLRKENAFNDLVLFGGRSRKEVPDLYKKSSPIFYVNNASAPTCIVQGLRDKLVRPSQSYKLQRSLKANHVPYQLITYNGGHVFEGLNQSEQEKIDLRALQCLRDILNRKPLLTPG
jgi:acetyl esterase/lipase